MQIWTNPRVTEPDLAVLDNYIETVGLASGKEAFLLLTPTMRALYSVRDQPESSTCNNVEAEVRFGNTSLYLAVTCCE